MTAPLFILALPNSYAASACAMIGQHPQLFGLPELNLFCSEQMGDLWKTDADKVKLDNRHGLLRALAEIYTGEQTDAAIECALHWCAAREQKSSGEIFNEIQKKISPLIPVDKSASYTFDIEALKRINEACPDARFIHLVRHPVPQCESVMSQNNGMFPLLINSIEYQEAGAIIEPQIAWHDINSNIMNFLEECITQDRHIRIRSEDLLGVNASKTLVQICRWLGIREDTGAISEMLHPERSPFSGLGPVTALFGNEPKFLNDPVFRPLKSESLPLDGPVSWRSDGKGLKMEVVDMATEFGY